jgi:hypothetical protein
MAGETPDPSASIDATTQSTAQLGATAEATAASMSNLNSSLDATHSVADNATKSLNGLDRISAGVSSTFNSFTGAMKESGISLENLNNVSEKSARSMAVMSAALLGTQEQFRKVLPDNESLNTYQKTLNSLKDTAESRKSVVGAIIGMADATGKKIDASSLAGKSLTELKNIVAGTFGSILTGADNASYARDAFIRLSATTGNLGEVFRAAGPNLENINKLVREQSNNLTQASMATGVSRDVVEKYWGQLGKVPGALKSVVEGTHAAGGQTDMLTASIQFATGSGRDYSAVVGDLTAAYNDFGATGKDAFSILGRLGEVADKTGVNFETVHKALMDSNSLLKEFSNGGKEAAANMTGLSSVMINYSNALKATGLSSNVSLDITKSMINQVEKLTTAQKSFLSQQSGGAGGLKGANQIDIMIREGKIDEVFEKVRKTMQGQLGTIVTQQEAAQSESAARQFERQKKMLTSGPLGGLVQNDQQAARVLESFRAQQEGRVGSTSISKDIANDTLDKGVQLQDKTNTILTSILTTLQGNNATQSLAQGRIMEQSASASGGEATDVRVTERQRQLQRTLRASRSNATVRGAQGAQNYNNSLKTGAYDISSVKSEEAAVLNQLGIDVKALPGAAGALVDTVTGNFASNSTAPTTTLATTKSALAMKAQEKSKNQSLLSAASITNPQYRDSLQSVGEETAAQQVGSAAGQSVQQNGNKAQTGSATNPQTTTDSSEHTVHLNVTGYCIKCKQEIEGSNQRLALNPTSK